MHFNRSVFVNCPFDEDYLPLLRSILFTIIYLGFIPRIALEELDSGSPRIHKIVGLVTSSRYAIHDLSRIQARQAGEFFRLNMPFELGIDVGCRLFGGGELALKRCLILETERYRYQAAISDLSGSDIAAHGGVPKEAMTQVRNWLDSQARLQAPGPSQIWTAFVDFSADHYELMKQRGFSDPEIEGMPVGELIRCMLQWAAVRPDSVK